MPSKVLMTKTTASSEYTADTSPLSSTSEIHSNHSSRQPQLSQHSTSLLSNHSIQVSNVSSIHMDSSPEQQQQQQKQIHNMSGSNDGNSKNEVIPSSQVSVPGCSSSSNQTLLTGHHMNDKNNGCVRVVAETPPVPPSSAAKTNANGRKRYSNSPAVTSKENSTANKNGRKSNAGRKRSNPVKNTEVGYPTPNTRKKRVLQFDTTSDDNLIESTSITPQPEPQSYNENAISRGSGSNPGRASSSKNDPPANNKKILDFFAVKDASSNAILTDTLTSRAENNTIPINNEINTVKSSQTTKVQTRTYTSTISSSTTSKDCDKLRNEMQHLEKLLSEKEQELKAVSNNQTIIQNRLKSTLLLKENEIQNIQKESEDKQQRLDLSLSLIETLVREDNLRKSNDLRQTLATDGARIGKIVHSRTNIGMSVESWEEGYAFVLLTKRKQQLQEKKKHLKALQQKQGQGNQENSSSENNSHKPILSLERLEEKESLRRKMSELDKEEIDIAKEEKNLKKEKSSHIRALKRLASEESSRFRAKPKLNDRYILLNLVGKGGFSEVWRAYDLISLQDVAVKIHQVNPMWSDTKKENYTKHVSREYEIHHEVRHPRIVSLLDVFEIDDDSFATVLEYCKGTDLDTLLKERKVLPEWEARGILLQILSGMNYLSTHSVDGTRAGIIHYDLKPGNILFDEYGDAKITDFGLSKIIEGADPADSMELTSQGAGTYWYLPPECFLLNQSVRISNKVDVWSIGVIFYEMLYGTKPFGDGQSQEKLFTNHTMLNARQVKFPTNKNITKECQEFIQACLTYEQIYRPSIAEICSHSYLRMEL